MAQRRDATVQLPSVDVPVLVYGMSEAALSVFKRSGTKSPDTDRSSLRALADSDAAYVRRTKRLVPFVY
jgi:hypothetical protein